MKQKQKKDAGTGMYFKVPNTPEGREFLLQLHAYATMGTRITSRGRGARAKHAVADGFWRTRYRQDLPRRHAEWFAVYIRRVRFEEVTLEEAKAYREAIYKRMEQASPEVSVRIEKIRRRFLRRGISLSEWLN